MNNKSAPEHNDQKKFVKALYFCGLRGKKNIKKP